MLMGMRGSVAPSPPLAAATPLPCSMRCHAQAAQLQPPLQLSEQPRWCHLAAHPLQAAPMSALL